LRVQLSIIIIDKLRRNEPLNDRVGTTWRKDGRDELIEGLNEDLANEYTAIISYMLFRGW
jgi:hypothetical protein